MHQLNSSVRLSADNRTNGLSVPMEFDTISVDRHSDDDEANKNPRKNTRPPKNKCTTSHLFTQSPNCRAASRGAKGRHGTASRPAAATWVGWGIDCPSRPRARRAPDRTLVDDSGGGSPYVTAAAASLYTLTADPEVDAAVSLKLTETGNVVQQNGTKNN